MGSGLALKAAQTALQVGFRNYSGAGGTFDSHFRRPKGNIRAIPGVQSCKPGTTDRGHTEVAELPSLPEW
jgi:hypothetical protein